MWTKPTYNSVFQPNFEFWRAQRDPLLCFVYRKCSLPKSNSHKCQNLEKPVKVRRKMEGEDELDNASGILFVCQTFLSVNVSLFCICNSSSKSVRSIEKGGHWQVNGGQRNVEKVPWTCLSRRIVHSGVHVKISVSVYQYPLHPL